MAAADPQDPRALYWYVAPEPLRAIECDCGRALDLPAECPCGRIWDRYGQLVATVWPPRQS